MDIARWFKVFYKNVKTFREREKILYTCIPEFRLTIVLRVFNFTTHTQT